MPLVTIRLYVPVAFVVTFAIAKVLGKVLPGGLRVSEEDEETGMDLALHSEVAYAPDRV